MIGSGGGRGGRGGASSPPSFRGVNGALAGQLSAQDKGDMAPTPAMRAAFAAVAKELATVQARWQRLVSADLVELNVVLTRNALPAVVAPARAAGQP